MFREMISLIFRSTRLCVTACGIMHSRCCRPVAWRWRNSASRLPAGIIQVHYNTSCNTQSSAPEDGRNHRSKHDDLIGIINKPLLLHLVGCLYYLYRWCTVKQISDWINFWCVFVHRCICVEKKTQLDVTVCFIALMIRSTCFGHFYAHHQEL